MSPIRMRSFAPKMRLPVANACVPCEAPRAATPRPTCPINSRRFICVKPFSIGCVPPFRLYNCKSRFRINVQTDNPSYSRRNCRQQLHSAPPLAFALVQASFHQFLDERCWQRPVCGEMDGPFGSGEALELVCEHCDYSRSGEQTAVILE